MTEITTLITIVMHVGNCLLYFLEHIDRHYLILR